MILTTEDFKTAPFELTLDPNQEVDLSVLIQEVEDDYLPILFGLELYNLFIADLALPVEGEPTAARFIKVFEPLNDQTDDILIRSEGIKYMLKSLTYFEYVRLLPLKVVTTGIKKTESNNATNVTAVKFDLIRRYNKGIEILKTLQYYMLDVNPDDYPEFKGVEIKYSDPF